MLNRKIEVYDIETLINCFTYTGFNIDTKEFVQFVIHKSKNNLDDLLDHLKSIRGQIGFNNLNFDGQVIQWILENVNHLKNCEDPAHEIYNYAQFVINEMNKGSWPIYAEWKMSIPQLDLFKIWHFDNKAKMTSLKWVEYSLDMENIEEMPIPHNKYIDGVEIESILNYNKWDVIATYKFYLVTIGQTDHPLYQGIDKIQLRKDIIAEFGIKCLNFNDVKIGDEINKFKYCELTGIDKKELPKPNKNIQEFKFKDCFPEYMEFKTTEFNNFVNAFANLTVRLKKETDKTKQEFRFTFNGTTYVVARGGIHSEDKPRLVKPLENEILRDADIGSQYPNSIRKRKLFPIHLGEKWLSGYTSVIQDRLGAKKKYKETKEPKYQAIQEAYKLALNGGGYGKLGEENSWQYSPFSTMCVTIGNQIEILMLIESLEINGIHVISANTDGIVCLFDKSKEELYYKLCKEWEIKVGNSDLGQLEYADYSLLVQTSVNSYLAIKTNGEVKKKSEFVTDFEIHKNKSARIIPLALEQYFVNGVPIETTIMNHKNIYDFCLGTKSIGTNRLIHLEPIKGNEIKLQKINRYYVSKNGWHLLKRLKPLENKKISRQLDIFGNENDGTRESEIEAGWLTTIYNRHVEKESFKDYNIDYDYYISGAKKIIEKIQPN